MRHFDPNLSVLDFILKLFISVKNFMHASIKLILIILNYVVFSFIFRLRQSGKYSNFY